MRCWTKEELNFIKHYYKDYPTKDIAKELKCTVNEVIKQAKKVGVEQQIPEGYRRCKICRKIKSVSEFYLINSKSLSIYCKECEANKRRENNLNKKLKSKIGADLEKKNLVDQIKKDTATKYYKCKNCGKNKQGKYFYFDSRSCKRYTTCIECSKINRQKNELKRIAKRGF